MAHKITISGSAQQFIINEGQTTIDVKSDLYSAWKLWVISGSNSKFKQALRTTGGDPLPGAQIIDGFFFLLNGWKLMPPSASVGDIEINGNLYSDDGSNVFGTIVGKQLIRQNVSSKALVSEVTSSAPLGLTPQQDAMLSDLYKSNALDSGSAVTYTTSSIDVSGSISQSIEQVGGAVIVKRINT